MSKQIYRCPNFKRCKFQGLSKVLQKHMMKHPCQEPCLIYNFVQPDQIWYQQLLSFDDKTMFCYRFDNYSFKTNFSFERYMLHCPDYMHYLEVQRTDDLVKFIITTGFELTKTFRLDTIFVRSNSVINSWDETSDDLYSTSIIWSYWRDAKQHSYFKFVRKDLEKFVYVYLLLVVKKKNYYTNVVNLLHNSTLQPC